MYTILIRRLDMKKTLTSILVALLSVATLFSLCACDNGEEPEQNEPVHVHTPSDTKQDNHKNATCIEKGSYEEYITCTDCYQEISRVTIYTDKLPHRFDDSGICLSCYNFFPDDNSGLMYRYNADDNSFSVSGIIEGDTREDIVIPSTVEGLPVTAIAGGAFFKDLESDQNIKSIYVPGSIKKVGNAFGYYGYSQYIEYDDRSRVAPLDVYIDNLNDWLCIEFEGPSPLCRGGNFYIGGVMTTEITIPDGITKINNHALSHGNFTDITLPTGVTDIGNNAFFNCVNLVNVSLPKSLANIGPGAFFGCSSLTNITIPDSVESIGNQAFEGCSAIKNIIVPDSIKRIGSRAFYNCESLESITLPFIGYQADATGASTHFGYIFYNQWYNDNRYAPEGAIKYEDHYYKFYIPSSLKTVIITGGDRVPDNAFRNLDSIENLILAPTITEIGECAFDNLQSLKSISFGENSQLTTIKYSAFYDCSSLKSIEIPPCVEIIDRYAFSNCTSLESITIPDSVTTIGKSAFSNCESITSIIIPNSITKIDDTTFYGCANLSSVIIPDTVTYIGNTAFRKCENLAKITIPDSVTHIGGGVFAECHSLTSVTIPSSAEFIGADVFYDCRNLESITLPRTDNIDSSAYGFIEFIFNTGNYNHSSIHNIPESVKYVNITGGSKISASDFVTSDRRSPINIVEIKISKDVTNIDVCAFKYCEKLQSIIVSDDNEVYKTVDGVLYTKDMKTLLSYPVAKSDETLTIPEGVTSIKDYAFRDTIYLRNVTIPTSITCIDKYAFYDCYSLTDITIPNSITKIDNYAFTNCVNLMSVTLGSGVESIGIYAFHNCIRLVYIHNFSKIDLSYDADYDANYDYGQIAKHTLMIRPKDGYSDTTTRFKEVDGYYFFVMQNRAYTGCYLVNYFGDETDITLPESYYGTSYYINDYAFYDRSDLTSVTIPSLTGEFSHSSTIDHNLMIGSHAFSGCSGLTSFTISEDMNSGYIDEYAFKNCSSLTSFVVPKFVTFIGIGAFQGCNLLNSITLPFVGSYPMIHEAFTDKVYDLIGVEAHFGYIFGMSSYSSSSSYHYINPRNSNYYRFDIPSSLKNVIIDENNIVDFMFQNCNYIESITISNNVNSIQNNAFKGCTALTDIYYTGTEAEWNEITIADGNDAVINANIHFEYVPED